MAGFVIAPLLAVSTLYIHPSIHSFIHSSIRPARRGIPIHSNTFPDCDLYGHTANPVQRKCVKYVRMMEFGLSRPMSCHCNGIQNTVNIQLNHVLTRICPLAHHLFSVHRDNQWTLVRSPYHWWVQRGPVVCHPGVATHSSSHAVAVHSAAMFESRLADRQTWPMYHWRVVMHCNGCYFGWTQVYRNGEFVQTMEMRWEIKTKMY